MIDCQEGEAWGKQNVGEDQIQEEDVCHRVELLILVDDEEDEPIPKVTQEKVDIIESWDESCTKVVDSLPCTEFDSTGKQVSDICTVIEEVQELWKLAIFKVHHWGLSCSTSML